MPDVDSTVVTTIPLSVEDAIKGKIDSLQKSLQQKLPDYESILHFIHRELAEHPDTVHLLSDEEVGIIVAGLQKRTGIFIAGAEADKKVKGKKGGVSLDDF